MGAAQYQKFPVPIFPAFYHGTKSEIIATVNAKMMRHKYRTQKRQKYAFCDWQKTFSCVLPRDDNFVY